MRATDQAVIRKTALTTVDAAKGMFFDPIPKPPVETVLDAGTRRKPRDASRSPGFPP
jgi:hypothetical protein